MKFLFWLFVAVVVVQTLSPIVSAGESGEGEESEVSYEGEEDSHVSHGEEHECLLNGKAKPKKGIKRMLSSASKKMDAIIYNKPDKFTDGNKRCADAGCLTCKENEEKYPTLVKEYNARKAAGKAGKAEKSARKAATK